MLFNQNQTIKSKHGYSSFFSQRKKLDYYFYEIVKNDNILSHLVSRKWAKDTYRYVFDRDFSDNGSHF